MMKLLRTALAAVALLTVGIAEAEAAAVNLTGSSPTYDTSGQKFGSGALNGGTASAPNLFSAGTNFTVEFWAKSSSSSGTQVMVGERGLFWVGLNGGKATFDYGNGDGSGDTSFAGTVNLADGAWHHYALQVDSSGKGTGYVDGTSIGTGAANTGGTTSSYAMAVRTYGGLSGFDFSGEVDELAIFSGTRYASSFTPSTAAYTGNEANLLHLYHVDQNLTDSLGTPSSTVAPNVAPNAAGIVYSPGNWNVTAAAATTINPGAYLSTLTSSGSVTLDFDVSNAAAPLPEIQYRIDGYETQSPWTTANVATNVAITMPSDTSAAPYHLVEMRFKSMTLTQNRWNAPSATAVVFKGFTMASGASLVAPGTAPGGKVLVFGDSITEGIRTVNTSASNDTDQGSAAMGYAYRLKDLLGVEVGVIGFGGSGLTVTGSGNVPVLGSSYNLMYGGQVRTPDTSTALIVLNEGTNDVNASAASVTSGMVTALNGLLSAYPSTPIAVLRPFNGSQASALQSAISQCSAPSRVTWIDTAGTFNTAYGSDSLNLHPTGANDLAVIAPQVAAKLRPLLTGATAAASFIPFRGMFAN